MLYMRMRAPFHNILKYLGTGKHAEMRSFYKRTADLCIPKHLPKMAMRWHKYTRKKHCFDMGIPLLDPKWIRKPVSRKLQLLLCLDKTLFGRSYLCRRSCLDLN